MATKDTFKFACPHCGQHLDAEYDMVGVMFDCPACGRSLTVPEIADVPHDKVILCESETSGHPSDTNGNAEAVCPAPPVITVIRKRERFIDKCKNRLKAVGIGIAVLLLFIGIGAINELLNDSESCQAGNGDAPHDVQKEKSNNSTAADANDGESCRAGNGVASHGMQKTKSNNTAVAEAVECLLNYLRVPTDRKLRVLSNSLETCPSDFQEAVKEYLVSVTKTSDDMMSAREREEMVKGRAVLGLLFGAASRNDPQSGVAAGLQIGNLICAEVEKKASIRLREEIEKNRSHLVDVGEKYGIDPMRFENALLGL